MIYIDNDGNRVVTIDDPATPVNIQRSDPKGPKVFFYPQGGGLQHSMEYDKFHATFKPAPEPIWRTGTVTAEWFYTDQGPDHIYPCYSNGEFWNGFGIPYFTRAAIDQMLTDFHTSWFAETVRWVDGKLMVTDQQEDETCEVVPVTIAGIDEPLYPLGASNWTWDAVKFDQ